MQLNNRIRRYSFAICIILLLTGCSSQEKEVLAPKTESQTKVGTDGALIAIHSDNVAAAGYDLNSKTMTVQFKNGYIYEYYGVTTDLWTSFLAAQPHPWSEVGYPRLVGEAFPYRRIR